MNRRVVFYFGGDLYLFDFYLESLFFWLFSVKIVVRVFMGSFYCFSVVKEFYFLKRLFLE